MKKWLALLCVMALVVGVCAASAVSASAAADPAKTAVDLKNGNEVTYTLKLTGVELPIIGCDYSIYYDSSLLELESVADFNNKTNENEWEGLINTKLDGEVRGNWSILKGVKFNEERNFITLKLKAKADGTAEISYFIRYMYDENIFNSDTKPQITEYKFLCDVKVDGDAVLEDAQPELNTSETQTSGLFVNSVTGDSDDADPEIPGTVVKKNAANTASSAGSSSQISGNNVSSGGVQGDTPNNPANNASSSNVSGGGNNQSAETAAPPATTAEGYYITETDGEGNVTATSDTAPVVDISSNNNNNNKGLVSSPVFWVVLVLVLAAGGGIAAFVLMKKRSAGSDAMTVMPADETASPLDGDDKTVAIDSEGPVSEADDTTASLEEEKTVILDEGDEKTVMLDEDKK